MTVDLYDKRYYINRELSWLEFNQRCLDEAMNNKTPLLDRAKFLAICYNNLEEFMMIRMPGILVQTPSAVQNDPDYIERPVILGMIYEKITSLYRGYEICWRRLKKNLAASIGISSRRVTSVIAFPLLFDSFTVSPLRTRRTICMRTTSSLFASTPRAVRAAFRRGT